MKFFSHFLAEKNYLLHNNIVQQILYFGHKYIFQRVLNQIQGVGDYDTHPLQCKMEIPGVGGRGEGV